MADYPIGMELVVDPDNPMNVVVNGSVGIYAPEDTAGTTLLPLKDANGFPLANPLTSNAYGFLPPFLAPLPQVRWISGQFTGYYNSFIGLRDEAVAAKNAAQDAQAEAASAGANAAGAAAGALAGAVEDAQEARVAAEAAANLVGAPADTAISTAINTSASATRLALDATYSTPAQVADFVARPAGVAKTAGGTIAAADAGKASTWDETSAFIIRLPDSAGFTAGQEFTLVSKGPGAAVVEPAARNYYPFSDVADFAGGIWTGRNGTLSVVPGASPTGRSLLRSTSTGASTSGAFGQANGSAVPALRLADMGFVAGDSIIVSAHLAPPASVNGRFQVRFYRSGTVISERTETGSPGSGTREIAPLTIPATADSLAIVTYSTASGAGATFDIGDIRIRKTGEPYTGFGDGNDPGWYWLGTPSASPSSKGMLIGGSKLPVPGSANLRYLGNGQWFISPLGRTPDVLTDTTQLHIDRDNGQAGIMAPSCPILSFSDTILTSGRIYAVRFVPSRDMIIKSIGFRVTTAATVDDPVEVGILDSTGARIGTSGSQSGKLNSTGQKTAVISYTPLSAGKVYFAYLITTTTGTAASIRRATVMAEAFGTGLPQAESLSVSGQSIPVGTTVTGMTVNDSGPIMALREFE